MFEHVTSHPDGYTACQTYTNPPGLRWVGRARLHEVRADHPPREWFETALATMTTWERHDVHEVMACTWYRKPFRVCGIPVAPHLLQSMMEWATEAHADGTRAHDTAELAAGAAQSIPFVAVRTGGRVAMLAALVDDPAIPHLADFIAILDKRPMFGPPVPILWFDEAGNGPIDGLEMTVRVLPGIDRCVMLRPEGLGRGAGSWTPQEARAFARQILDAADWCEQHAATGGRP